MIDKRIEGEKDLYFIVVDLMDKMAGKKIQPNHFMTLMGQLRDLKVKLENKRFGCASGRHSTNCDC